MNRKYWWAFVLATTLLWPALSLAEQRGPKVKLVETAIGGRITDQYGQPLQLPRGLHIIFFKFHQKSWDEAVWAHIKTRPDSDGRFLATGVFPIDSSFMVAMVKYVAGREKADIDVGIQVLDLDDHILACPNGVRFELSRYGLMPWPPGKVAVIKGRLDDAGRMWPKMSMPVDAITLRNFTLLAQGRGM